MELFHESMTPEQVRAYPVLTLAHIGDGVYELLARSAVLHGGTFQAREAHRRTVALVSAEAQCAAAHRLLDKLDEEEAAVFRRGRNASPKTVPRHAGTRDYAFATGLEALFGYLYLLGRGERILALWDMSREARP